MRGFLRAPPTTIELPWQPKDDSGKQIKQQQLECLWNFFYVFLLSMIECMSINLQRTWLGGFGQSSPGCFSCRVNADSVKRAHCGAGSNSAHSCAELFTTFCRCFWCFLSWKTYRPRPFRRNSRKPLTLAENKVYSLPGKIFEFNLKPRTEKAWRKWFLTWSPVYTLHLSVTLPFSFILHFSFFLPFFFATKGYLDCKQMIESSL